VPIINWHWYYFLGKGNHSNLGNVGRPIANSTNDTSISIEETNRIRAELGLKPLEVEGQNSNNVEASSDKKDVHVPAGNNFS
jgi:hypothetical protein